MLPGMLKSVKEWTLTLLSELSFWELEFQWTLEYSKGNFRGQNPLDWRVIYIIENLLKCRCLKWAQITHLKSETQIMAKSKVKSQIDSLTPNH